MTERHIVIVGGGIMGVCSAYFLSKHPLYDRATTKVTLVEGTAIAAGASGKAGGLLALDWHGAATSSLAEISYKLHRSLAEEHDGAKKWQYRPLKTLSISADFTGTPSSFSPPTVAPDLAWLDEKVLRGSEVLGTERTTAQVHPWLFTRALARMAEEAGVCIVIGSAASLIRHPPASASSPPTFSLGLENPLTEISGITDLILTAGPWTGELAKKLGLKIGRGSGITGSRAHSVLLDPTEHGVLPAQALFTSIKENRGGLCEPEIYNRPDNTAYCCGASDNTPLPATAAGVKVSAPATAKIMEQISKLSPLLAKAKKVREQACYLPVGSRDGEPVIGRLSGEERVYIGSGHSCWGITHGPGTGKCLAELVMDGAVSSADIGKLGP